MQDIITDITLKEVLAKTSNNLKEASLLLIIKKDSNNRAEERIIYNTAAIVLGSLADAIMDGLTEDIK